jgi:hypothetical protein
VLLFFFSLLELKLTGKADSILNTSQSYNLTDSTRGKLHNSLKSLPYWPFLLYKLQDLSHEERHPHSWKKYRSQTQKLTHSISQDDPEGNQLTDFLNERFKKLHPLDYCVHKSYKRFRKTAQGTCVKLATACTVPCQKDLANFVEV